MNRQKQTLIDLTQNFWKQKESNKKNSWGLYLVQASTERRDTKEKSLLEYEMEYAGQQKNTEGIQTHLPAPHSNITLVILVGESLEPLFQSIWAHNPKRLIPVVNEWYPPAKDSDGPIQGTVHWAYIRDLMKNMLERPSRNGNWQLTTKTLPKVEYGVSQNRTNSYKPIQDDPEIIFTYLQSQLRDDLLNPDCRVVIDITGAKKTMVAGAFMLAAYSDARICYIDTELHDESEKFCGRPYGFACRFRTITNPVKTLSLQNWDKLGELYDQYNFANALNLLPGDSAFSEVTDLRHFLCMCHYWEIGQLTLAWEEAQKLPENLKPHIPLAVKDLHTCWPQPESPEATDTLFDHARNVIIYVYDELHRVYRLKSIKKSYRDAFSRAYAVYETLFKARAIALYKNEQIQVLPVRWDKQIKQNVPLDENVSPRIADTQQPWYEKVLKACLRIQSHVARKLLREGVVVLEWEKKKFQMNWIAVKPSERLADELNPGEKLREKRNEITHSYMPVIEEDVNDAIRKALLNFDDYLRKWVAPPTEIAGLEELNNEENYRVPDWERLQGICNLHFIPVESRDNEGDVQ